MRRLCAAAIQTHNKCTSSKQQKQCTTTIQTAEACRSWQAAASWWVSDRAAALASVARVTNSSSSLSNNKGVWQNLLSAISIRMPPFAARKDQHSGALLHTHWLTQVLDKRNGSAYLFFTNCGTHIFAYIFEVVYMKSDAACVWTQVVCATNKHAAKCCIKNVTFRIVFMLKNV